MITAAKTDIWRVDCISRGSFRHAVRRDAQECLLHTYLAAQGDGPDWKSFSGEIVIKDSINIGAFRASGLSVKVRVNFLGNPCNSDI